MNECSRDKCECSPTAAMILCGRKSSRTVGEVDALLGVNSPLAAVQVTRERMVPAVAADTPVLRKCRRCMAMLLSVERIFLRATGEDAFEILPVCNVIDNHTVWRSCFEVDPTAVLDVVQRLANLLEVNATLAKHGTAVPWHGISQISLPSVRISLRMS